MTPPPKTQSPALLRAPQPHSQASTTTLEARRGGLGRRARRAAVGCRRERAQLASMSAFVIGSFEEALPRNCSQIRDRIVQGLPATHAGLLSCQNDGF